jgi:DNA helicase II / ATP-dependent DNA helicase PcrA
MLHGQVRYGIASRFLDEIPEALLKRLNSKPMAKNYASGGHYQQDNNQAIAPSQASQYPFKIGSSVRHAKFGDGVVVTYEGSGANLVIKINFGNNGLKTLAMEYAKLEKI